jgi:hypothetical protein
MGAVIKKKFRSVKGRGATFCRGCGSTLLFTGINLGNMALANEFLSTKDENQAKFPLHLRICESCALGQIEEVVNKKRIFLDYRYTSSTSKSFSNHSAKFVENYLKSELLIRGDWVLEIASNDGYLLKHFQKNNIHVLGIEPARNIADFSRNLGIPTINGFFSSKMAKRILKKYGFPKLIIANNVLAHVPDIQDFYKGLSILCGEQTKISVENPPISNIISKLQFDTIYHEHYSYLSAMSIKKLSSLNQLQLFQIEKIDTHGGSYRFWLRKNDDTLVDYSVDHAIEEESVLGITSKYVWQNLEFATRECITNFKKWLREAEIQKKNVYGYGAAAKTSVILGLIGDEVKVIKAIADESSEKQGRYIPSVGIKIVHPREIFTDEPTDIIIFPWNIKQEIVEFIDSNSSKKIRKWCVIPNVHQVN